MDGYRENPIVTVPVTVCSMRWTPSTSPEQMRRARLEMRKWALENGAIRVMRTTEGGLSIQSFDRTATVSEGQWLFRLAPGVFRVVTHEEFSDHYLSKETPS